MGNPIGRILKIGLRNTVPILEYRQILVTNYLAFFCIGSAIFMGGMSLLLPFTSQAITCFVAAILMCSVFYFNHHRHHRIALGLLIWIIILTILTISAFSIIENKPNGSEYLFIAVMTVPILLLEVRERHFYYWGIFCLIILVKVARYEYVNAPYDWEFYLTTLNLLFAAWFIYLFLGFIKKVLVKAVAKTNEHENTLYSLLDNVPIFMALVDKQGSYRIANRHYANMFGHDKSDIIGKKRDRILPQNILESHNPYFSKALEGEIVDFLERNSMPDGTSIYAKGSYFPIKRSDGTIEAISIYVDDVTELVEAEESLRRASETKDKLFSIIAHDIRSPLNLFQSILNVSDEEIISKEEFMVYQKELKERLVSLSARLDELLNWARVQMGGINAYPCEVDVNEVVKENADLFKTLIKKKNIEFNTNLLCDVDGWMDENHLQVAVRNLLHNALKFTEVGGTVTIDTSKDDDSVLVEIMDTGAGMTKEVIDSILKREIQKSTVGTSGEVGTGLGLSLSMGLLKSNDCIVSLDSEPGKGSTFRIWIPKSDINDPVVA